VVPLWLYTKKGLVDVSPSLSIIRGHLKAKKKNAEIAAFGGAVDQLLASPKPMSVRKTKLRSKQESRC
jgi:hypothetical protein